MIIKTKANFKLKKRKRKENILRKSNIFSTSTPKDMSVGLKKKKRNPKNSKITWRHIHNF